MLKELTAIILLFLLFIGLIYIFQRSFIYFPDKNSPQRAAYQAEDLQEIILKTQDGLSLVSWYKPAKPLHPTILYFHGNAGHIGYRMPIARAFINAGYGVLLLEYRGYGGNKGNPGEQGFYEDGRTAIHYLLSQGVKASELVLYGESIGSAVATQLAVGLPVCALILQAPFTSLAAAASYHYPWLLLAPWEKFDSLGVIANITGPILILHGKQDTIIPYQQGVELFNKAAEPKKMISFSDRGHNNLWDQNYYQQVINFISAHCLGKPNRDL